MIVFEQLDFLRTKDLGFDKERIIKIPLLDRELQQRGNILAERMTQLPNVELAALGTATPGDGISKTIMNVEDQEGKMVDQGVDLFM